MVDISCILAAALFAASNSFSFIWWFKIRPNFDWSKRRELDPDYLANEWEYRNQHKGLFMASTFVNALAWFVFAFPLVKLAWILSQRGAKSIGMHVSIAVLAVAAALCEWLSHLCWIGLYFAEKHILELQLGSWDRLYSALEIIHVADRGFVWIVDSFEWMFLSIILILVYISVRYWRAQDVSTFGGCWNSLGLLIGLMSLTEFILEVIRFEGVREVRIAIWIYSIANRLIFIPGWILTLGYTIDRAAVKQSYANGGPAGELALTEMQSGGGHNDSTAPSSFVQPPPQSAFTIDDNEGAHAATTKHWMHRGLSTK